MIRYPREIDEPSYCKGTPPARLLFALFRFMLIFPLMLLLSFRIPVS